LCNRSGVKRPSYLHFIAGSAAGFTGQALTYPLDRARAVMAVTPMGEYRNLLAVFRRIVSQEGLFALYRGFVPTMVGVIPYAGVSFFTFETLKKYWTKRGDYVFTIIIENIIKLS
jgi:solute carrier family 25 protein 42